MPMYLFTTSLPLSLHHCHLTSDNQSESEALFISHSHYLSSSLLVSSLSLVASGIVSVGIIVVAVSLFFSPSPLAYIGTTISPEPHEGCRQSVRSLCFSSCGVRDVEPMAAPLGRMKRPAAAAASSEATPKRPAGRASSARGAVGGSSSSTAGKAGSEVGASKKVVEAMNTQRPTSSGTCLTGRWAACRRRTKPAFTRTPRLSNEWVGFDTGACVQVRMSLTCPP